MKKNKCPICYNKKAILGKKCKRCGWEVNENLDFYIQKGFTIENGEIAIDEKGKPISSKKLRAKMPLNAIYAIGTGILLALYMLIAMAFWSIDVLSDSWMTFFGIVFALIELRCVLLATRTKFGYKWNMLRSYISATVCACTTVMSLISGFRIAIIFLLIIFLIACRFKKKKNNKPNKIVFAVAAIALFTAIVTTCSPIQIITYAISGIEVFMCIYYKKKKNIYLGVVKRKKPSGKMLETTNDTKDVAIATNETT